MPRSERLCDSCIERVKNIKTSSRRSSRTMKETNSQLVFFVGAFSPPIKRRNTSNMPTILLLRPFFATNNCSWNMLNCTSRWGRGILWSRYLMRAVRSWLGTRTCKGLRSRDLHLSPLHLLRRPSWVKTRWMDFQPCLTTVLASWNKSHRNSSNKNR